MEFFRQLPGDGDRIPAWMLEQSATGWSSLRIPCKIQGRSYCKGVGLVCVRLCGRLVLGLASVDHLLLLTVDTNFGVGKVGLTLIL